MKTFSLKYSEINKKWIVIDAKNAVLGRLAAFIASRIRGKHLPTFSPHMDCGDNIIVINADKVHLSGNNKMSDMKFYWHTGYPGGIKEKSAKTILEGKYPERLIFNAVKRMLSKGPLSRSQMKNLKIYASDSHPHMAQSPVIIDFASLNEKNVCRSM